MKIKRILKMLMGAALISAMCLAPAKAARDDKILKIGLFYGSNALPAANLQNVTGIGYGYEIGYFDSSRNFVPLYGVDTNKITTVKDKLIYINSSNTYYDVMPSSYTTVIKPYHIQMTERFNSENEAKNALNMLKNYNLSAFGAYVNGEYAVRCGQYSSNSEAAAACEQAGSLTGFDFEVCGYSSTCYTVTVTGTDTILFEFDNGGSPMGIMPVNEESSDKPQTWFKGYKYYGGFEYNRVNGNDITVINYVGEDDYAKGVIPYEMNPNWHVEALKVQAVCAKSYAQNCIGKHKSQGFDLCNTTHCQVYYGTNKATKNSDNAVESVSGLYVVYDNKIAQTFYHASSGGHTEDVENIWGNYVPYLRGVPDDYLKYVKSGYENWSYTVTLDQIEKILKAKNYSVTELTDFYVSKYSKYGNVIQLAYVDKTYGKKTVSGDSARTLLNSSTYGISVLSHRYTVSQSGGGVYVGTRKVNGSGISGLFAVGKDLVKKALTGNWNSMKVLSKNGINDINVNNSDSSAMVIQGSGSGHNIGMSQWGTRGMAEKGISYDDIVKHYFTGVKIGNVN